jgi:hypothetical protein
MSEKRKTQGTLIAVLDAKAQREAIKAHWRMSHRFEPSVKHIFEETLLGNPRSA